MVFSNAGPGLSEGENAMDKKLREIAQQHEEGVLTYVEFKNLFHHRLAEITDAVALIALATAVADFDDGILECFEK